jgi:hypothetical protein
MIVQNVSFLQNNGDSLLFGHRTQQNENTQTDLPIGGVWATAPNPQRWARHWYIDLRDVGFNNGSVDIIFDFSEGSMNDCCPPGGALSNYRLLQRPNATGSFTDLGGATAIVGDQVFFQNVNVSLLGSNFTLGTLNSTDSPTAVTLQDFNVTNNNMSILLIGSLLVLALISTGIILRRRDRV